MKYLSEHSFFFKYKYFSVILKFFRLEVLSNFYLLLNFDKVMYFVRALLVILQCLRIIAKIQICQFFPVQQHKLKKSGRIYIWGVACRLLVVCCLYALTRDIQVNIFCSWDG